MCDFAGVHVLQGMDHLLVSYGPFFLWIKRRGKLSGAVRSNRMGLEDEHNARAALTIPTLHHTIFVLKSKYANCPRAQLKKLAIIRR